ALASPSVVPPSPGGSAVALRTGTAVTGESIKGIVARLRIEHTFAYGPAVALAALPRRDEHTREHLDNAARHARPVVLAGERVLAVSGPLGARLPRGGVRRGTVVAGHRPPRPRAPPAA